MSGVELLPCPFCAGEASDEGHIGYSRGLLIDGFEPVNEHEMINQEQGG